MDMKKIEDLLAELKIAFGDNLISAVLYGSSVTGDSTPEFSRENLFLLLKDDALDLFRPALPALNKWVKAGHSIPHFFSERRFQDSEDVFPIEFSDIQAHHRVLFGTDPFQDLKIESLNLRYQLEFELRSKLIQLRQRYLESGGQAKQARELMARSLSTFSVLFKSVLRLLGEPAPSHKKETWAALARHTAMDIPTLEQIWDIRHGKELADKQVDVVFGAYVKCIEGVIDFVDQRK